MLKWQNHLNIRSYLFDIMISCSRQGPNTLLGQGILRNLPGMLVVDLWFVVKWSSSTTTNITHPPPLHSTAIKLPSDWFFWLVQAYQIAKLACLPFTMAIAAIATMKILAIGDINQLSWLSCASFCTENIQPTIQRGELMLSGHRVLFRLHFLLESQVAKQPEPRDTKGTCLRKL